MSEPMTPLNGAAFDGLVRVEELPRRGMITLRADQDAAALREVAAEVTGLSMPEPRHASVAGERLLAWMSPDELMLMLPPAEVAGTLQRIGTALSGTHHLAAEVTDARALFRVSGADAAVRESLAKLAPVDFAPVAFVPGMFRRTRLAQVPAAFWCEGEGTFGIMCFRSVAAYAYGALRVSAAKDGAVGHF